MKTLDDVLMLGLALVLIGDIIILWVELARRREEKKRIEENSIINIGLPKQSVLIDLLGDGRLAEPVGAMEN